MKFSKFQHVKKIHQMGTFIEYIEIIVLLYRGQNELAKHMESIKIYERKKEFSRRNKKNQLNIPLNRQCYLYAVISST